MENIYGFFLINKLYTFFLAKMGQIRSMKMRKKVMLVLLLSNMAVAKVGFNLRGEEVAYYQTDNASSNNFFSQDSSKGSLGLQVEVTAKVDNGFELGYEGTLLGTLGLEKSIISTARQNAQANDLNAYATTEIFLFKKVKDTKIKLGRQKLSMELSPLAFSEDWNVFENSFDALMMTNNSMKDTTIMASYINKSNKHNDLSDFNDLGNGVNAIEGGIYLLTVANESSKKLPISASYYLLKDVTGLESGSALWLDVKSTHTPLKMAFQAGYIDPKNTLSTSKMFGTKVSKAYAEIALSLAYSTVSSGDFSFQNFGTAGDVPFYTQMVNNQDFIALDADTFVLKGSTKLPVGNLTLQYGLTKDTSSVKNDFTELDVVYKFDLLATKMFVGYIRQTTDKKVFVGEGESNTIRVWSRYTF